MLPVIITNLITTGSMSGTTETSIELANGCFARRFSNDSWTHIRVAMRWRVKDDDTYIYGIPKYTIAAEVPLFVGFSSGTSSIYGDASATHVWGVKPTVGNTLVPVGTGYMGLTSSYYTAHGSSYRIINGVETLLAGATQGALWYFPASTSSCDAMMFDLKKTGSNLIVPIAFIRFSTGGQGEYYPTSTFLSDIQTLAPTRTGYLQSTVTSHSFTETSGSINSVNISWARAHPRLQIIDLYVVRLA